MEAEKDVPSAVEVLRHRVRELVESKGDGALVLIAKYLFGSMDEGVKQAIAEIQKGKKQS